MASPLKVEFHFDVGSPNACLAERVPPDIESMRRDRAAGREQ